MLYDLDPVPEDNTKKPEVKDYEMSRSRRQSMGILTRLHEFAYLIF
jgi:hypothetical protein